MKFRSEALRDLFRAVERAGWRWRKGGSHIVVYPPDGSPPLMLSQTAYDGKANKDIVARFRRAGLRV